MAHSVSSFPLLNLPNAPLKCVLLNMELFYQMGFSILSKNSKKLIKSLNLKVQQVSVTIDLIVRMEICSRNQFNTPWLFYHEGLHHNDIANGVPTNEMYKPVFIRSCYLEAFGFRQYNWKQPGFRIKDWIDHFVSIFNRPKLDQLAFTGITLFDLESLQKTISDVTEIRISSEYPIKYIQQIVQTYPSANKLDLFLKWIPDLEGLHSTICRNFDVLTLRPRYPGNVYNCKLNDLLVMNSRSIKISDSNLSQRDVNTFLKHWINGSNPRMEHFAIRFMENRYARKEIILHGIKHQIVPSDQERLFKSPVEVYYDPRDVICYDIQRKDGTTATIVSREHQPRFFAVEVVVWH